MENDCARAHEITKEEMPKTLKIGQKLAREEGLCIGLSATAIMYVALQKAKQLGRGKTIVAVVPDDGMKYLSTPLFGDR